MDIDTHHDYVTIYQGHKCTGDLPLFDPVWPEPWVWVVLMALCLTLTRVILGNLAPVHRPTISLIFISCPRDVTMCPIMPEMSHDVVTSHDVYGKYSPIRRTLCEFLSYFTAVFYIFTAKFWLTGRYLCGQVHWTRGGWYRIWYVFKYVSGTSLDGLFHHICVLQDVWRHHFTCQMSETGRSLGVMMTSWL